MDGLGGRGAVGKEQVHSSKVPIMVLQEYEEGNDSASKVKYKLCKDQKGNGPSAQFYFLSLFSFRTKGRKN